MDGNLNKGAWKKMENKWADALKEDPPKQVKVDIKVVYNGDAKRPDKFVVKYEIDGVQEKAIFRNKPGGK